MLKRAARLFGLTVAVSLLGSSGCASPPSRDMAEGDTSATATAAREPVSLGESLAPLRDRFNADKGKARFIAILSPR